VAQPSTLAQTAGILALREALWQWSFTLLADGLCARGGMADTPDLGFDYS